MPNDALRRYAQERKVPLWKVADAFGINDGNLSRRLRHEFTVEQAARFKQIVDTIATDGEPRGVANGSKDSAEV